MLLFLCSILMQSIQIHYGVLVMFVVTCFLVIVVKNGRGLLDHETMKSAVSQEIELIKRADFFACWYKFRKANVNLIIIGWTWSKMGQTVRSYKTLKSSSSHIWFDQSRRLIQWFLVWQPIYSIFDIFWESTAVVLVKNDVLFLVPTGK